MLTFNSFVTHSVVHCGRSFEAIEAAASRGSILDVATGRSIRPVFPSMLIAYDLDRYYAAELVGATAQRPTSLPVVRRTLKDLAAFLGNFPAPSTQSMFVAAEPGARDMAFANFSMMGAPGESYFAARYPELGSRWPSRVCFSGDLAEDQAFAPFSGLDSIEDIRLLNVLLVPYWRGVSRARYFQAAWVFSSTLSSSELSRRMRRYFPLGDTGLLPVSVDADSSRWIEAANFASLASLDKIGETTITQFLASAQNVLRSAFRCQRLIPQPYLEWLEGNPDPQEKAIQPDFLLVDGDGRLLVCEVKLPLLDVSSLTVGGHRRRRFRSEVYEGIAQLANYADYFTFPKNQGLLTERYNVDPAGARLILLVGSDENFDGDEVAQAMRGHQPVEIVDYDTVRALFATEAGLLAPDGQQLSREAP